MEMNQFKTRILLLKFFCIALGVDESAASFLSTKNKTVHPEESSIHWSYIDSKSWLYYYKNCAGPKQSPIDIDEAFVKRINIPPLKFVNYDRALKMEVVNNGHSVELTPIVNDPKRDLPYITDGNLPGQYILQKLHFHWGANKKRGSEHTFSKKKFAAELHIVHYNQKYGSITNALQYPDGLAVLGIMIETQRRENPIFRHFVDHLKSIRYAGKKFRMNSPITLGDLLPDNTRDFYRYYGSLTTPGCRESVVWTIFKTPIAVSEQQLDLLRKTILDSKGGFLVDNYRPIQKKNRRLVYFSRI